MSEVTGQIGNDQVYLDNAATEATLQLLLKATLATTKAQKQAIAEMAEKAGLDAESVGKANRETSLLGDTARGVGSAFRVITGITSTLGGAFQGVIGFAEKIANNEGKASNVFSALNGLPFGIGKVMEGFSALQKIQEQQLEAYQKMTVSGVGFSGNLDQIRMTAGRLNLTLDQFADLMARNGEGLSRFGGNVNDGARAFVRISADLNNGPTGRALRGLGYTSEQISEHLIKYVAISGGRTKDELRNTQKITQQTESYLKELDRLSEITGKSREELEKQLEAQTLEANWQLFLGKLEDSIPGASNRLSGAINTWTGLFGDAGADIIKASAMNMQAQSEGARKIAEISPQTYAYMQQYGKAVRDGTMSQEDLRMMQLKIRQQWANDAKELAGASGSFNKTFADVQQAGLQAARDRQIGSLREMDEVDKKIRAEQEKRGDSQAADQADKQVAMIKMANEMMSALLELSKQLSPVMNFVLQKMQEFVTWLATTLKENPNLMKDFVLGLKDIYDTFMKLKTEVLNPTFTWIGEKMKQFGISLGDLVLGAAAVFLAFKTLPTIIGGAKWLMNRGKPEAFGPPSPGGGGAASGLAGLSSQFNAAAGWLFKGLAIGASMVAIGYGLTKLGEGLQAFSGGKVDWDGMGKAAVTLGVLSAAVYGLGRILAGPAAAYFAIGVVAIGALGLALQAFPADVLESLGVLFDKVGHTIGDVFAQVIDHVGGLVKTVGETIVLMIHGIADGVTKLANIGGANLIATAGGIGAVGTALGVFGVGGALAGLVSGLGGFDSIARGLTALGAVDASNLGNVAKGMRDFSDNLPGFWQSIGDATKLSSFGSALEPLGINLERISKTNPGNLILLSNFIKLIVDSKLGSAGVIIFTDHTVDLMKQFASLVIKPNIDQIVRLKDVAINEMPKASESIDRFNTSLGNLLKADVAKIKELAGAITELKTSMSLDPNQDTSAIESIMQRIIPGSSGSTATPGSKEAAESGPFATNTDYSGNTNQLLERGLEDLNNNMARLLNISSQISDNTYRTATKASGGDLFRR